MRALEIGGGGAAGRQRMPVLVDRDGQSAGSMKREQRAQQACVRLRLVRFSSAQPAARDKQNEEVAEVAHVAGRLWFEVGKAENGGRPGEKTDPRCGPGR